MMKEMKILTVDFEKIYTQLASNLSATQKKLDIDSSLNVYYGISEEGYYRLSFMSKSKYIPIDSTKTLRVLQGYEKDEVYWTCFDLLNMEAKKVFYTFCQNLVEAIIGQSNEKDALVALKKRYNTWKTLFKKDFSEHIPLEKLQGLYGELFFLKKHMFSKYGIESSIKAWGGPEFLSKDFSIGTDWYEIKTIGANSQNIKISSLAQLSSSFPGRLVAIKVENMSDEFNNGESSIGELLTSILEQVDSAETENILLDKISQFCNENCIELNDACMAKKFDVKSLKHYIVDKDFPRITEQTVPYTEITSVEYTLSVAAIEKFEEVLK